jgi:hypothetical protein
MGVRSSKFDIGSFRKTKWTFLFGGMVQARYELIPFHQTITAALHSKSVLHKTAAELALTSGSSRKTQTLIRLTFSTQLISSKSFPCNRVQRKCTSSFHLFLNQSFK